MSHDQSFSNTFFFRPEHRFGDPREGAIRALSVINPAVDKVQTGIVLGSAVQAYGENGRARNFQVLRPNSEVVWASSDEAPDVHFFGKGEGVLRSGSVAQIGRRKLIVRYQKDGALLVHVQTGMFGRPDMNAFAEHVKAGGLFAHGTFALEPDAAETVGTQESSETDLEHAPQGELATRIRWRLGKNINGFEFPFRREDLWRIPRGAGILVAGIYDGELSRLVNDNGILRKVDAPQGRALFERFEADRRERNRIAREKRLKEKENRLATPDDTLGSTLVTTSSELSDAPLAEGQSA